MVDVFYIVLVKERSYVGFEHLNTTLIPVAVFSSLSKKTTDTKTV